MENYTKNLHDLNSFWIKREKVLFLLKKNQTFFFYFFLIQFGRISFLSSIVGQQSILSEAIPISEIRKMARSQVWEVGRPI